MTDDAAPTQSPPSTTGGAAGGPAAGTTQPSELQPEQVAITAAPGAASSPTLEPPPRAGVGAIGALAGWQSDKRVTALWSIAETRNAWAHIADIGWRKLANNSDSAIVAMTMLTAHARQANARIDFNEGGNGMIDQMYIW